LPQAADQQGLAEPGKILDQDVPVGQGGGEDEPHRRPLADHRLRDRLHDAPAGRRHLVHSRSILSTICSSSSVVIVADDSSKAAAASPPSRATPSATFRVPAAIPARSSVNRTSRRRNGRSPPRRGSTAAATSSSNAASGRACLLRACDGDGSREGDGTGRTGHLLHPTATMAAITTSPHSAIAAGPSNWTSTTVASPTSTAAVASLRISPCPPSAPWPPPRRRPPSPRLPQGVKSEPGGRRE